MDQISQDPWRKRRAMMVWKSSFVQRPCIPCHRRLRGRLPLGGSSVPPLSLASIPVTHRCLKSEDPRGTASFGLHGAPAAVLGKGIDILTAKATEKT
jgi:hypothetical protein